MVRCRRHRVVIRSGQGLGSQFAVNGYARHGDAPKGSCPMLLKRKAGKLFRGGRQGNRAIKFR